MDVDVDYRDIIALVYERPAIWNREHPRHANNTLMRQYWTEISRELNCDERTVKRKWKYLRDHYAVELGKMRQTQLMNPVFVLETNWPFFHLMEFVKDHVTPRTNVKISNKILPSSGQCSVNHGDGNAAIFNDHMYETPMADSEVKLVEDQDGSSKCLNPKSVKCKRPLPGDLKETLLDLKRRRAQRDLSDKSDQMVAEDEDMFFLKSLLPHIKKIPQEKMLRFRIRVQEIVDEFAYPSISNAQEVFVTLPTCSQ